MGMYSGSLLALVCGGLFALALGAVGVVLTVMFFRNKNKAKASEGWPQVEGRVVSTNIRVDEMDDEDSYRVSYIPEVHFEYHVEGLLFDGKRIAFGSEVSFGMRKKAEAFLTEYPVGSAVSVFYNPDNPKEAVLSQKMRSMTAGLVVGIVLIVAMVCLMCPIAIGLFDTFFG